MPRHGPGLGAGSFPSANKLLSRYETDRAQRIHRQKLNSMKHRLDVKEPKKHNHLILRLKQIQKEEERQAEIDHENKLLLAKMTHVMKYGGNIDNWNTYESRSLNYPLRERQNDDIARENLGIARRLETVKPQLNLNAWEKDYKKHAYLKRLWNDNAKDYGVFTPRRFRSRMSKARSLETSLDGDDDNRSYELEDRRLPKLNDKSKKGNNLRATQSESNGPVSSRRDEPKSKPSTKFPKIVPHKALIEHDYSMYYGSISSLNKLSLDSERSWRPILSGRHPEDDGSDEEISPYIASSARDNTDKKDRRDKVDKINKANDKGNDTDRNKKKQPGDKNAERNNKNKGNSNLKDELHTNSRTSFQSANIPTNDLERVETLMSKEKDKANDEKNGHDAATSEDKIDEESAESNNTDTDDAEKNKAEKLKEGDVKAEENHLKDSHDKEGDIAKCDNKTDTNIDTNASKNQTSKEKVTKDLDSDNDKSKGGKGHENKTASKNKTNTDKVGEKDVVNTEDKATKDKSNKIRKDKTENKVSTDKDKMSKPVTEKTETKGSKNKADDNAKGKSENKVFNNKTEDSGKAKSDKKVSKDKTAETKKEKPETKKKSNAQKSNTSDKENGEQQADGAAAGGNKDSSQEDSSDVAQLFKIAKQLGKPEEIFIRTLIKKTHKQRMKTKAKFREKYDLDLIKELKNGLGEPWERLIDALLQERGDADCYTLFDALSTVDICDVVELLCSRDSAAIAEIKESYRKEFSISIEEDIADRTKPPVQTLLMILQGSREESGDVDASAARSDAQALHEADEGRWDDDDGVFLTLLKTRSFAHMQAVFTEYKSVSEGQDVLKAMKAECDKEYFNILSTLVHCIGSPASYYAEQIHKHKLPTDQVFINILVTRSEVDMPSIRKIYKRNFGIDITEEIKSKPHPTQKCLIELASKVPPGSKAGGDAKQKGAKTNAAPGPATIKKPPAGRPANNQATASTAGGADTESKPKPTKQKQDNQETDKPAQAKKPGEGQGAKKKAPAAQKEDGNHNGTVRPQAGFRPDDDCDRLNGAMSGIGTNEQVIISIIPRRSNKQRQKLKQVYEQKFKKNLMIDLESELTGDTEEIVLALMMSPAEYDAYILHEAVEGLGTSEGTLVGILCSRTAQEIKSIREHYKKAYKTEMELDVTRDTDGHLKEVFTRLCRGERLEETAVNGGQAKQDADALYKKGEAPLDPSSDVFQNLLVCKNQYQVKATLEEYKKLAGHDFYTALTQAGLGDDEESYTSIAKATEDPVAFHTEKLHSCFNNMGTNDNMLIRIIVSRSEIDTRDIKGRYSEMYGQNLVDVINRECRGDYKTLLLAVLDENQGSENEKPKGSSASKGGKPKVSKGGKTSEDTTSAAAVKPCSPFNPMEDSVRIHDAMKGFGTDESVLIEILPKRTNEQRQEIQAKYETKYNKNLREELKDELRSDFEEVVLALMMTPLQYDVYCLHDAVDGLGTSEGILIGILSTRNGKELAIIKEEYKKTYGTDLQDDITSDVSGGFEDMLVQILKCEREQGTIVDQKMAADDAKRLYKDGQISIDPKDETFMAILAKRNRFQVRATFEEYEKLTGKDIYYGIEKAFIGDTERGYKGLALAIENPVLYYAERLKECFDGIGTNDKRLIRIIVSRSEVDLLDIKKKFKTLYNQTLADAIKSECGGDYKQMLLAILGDHVTQKNP